MNINSMKIALTFGCVLGLAGLGLAQQNGAQEGGGSQETPAFADISQGIQQRLAEALEELSTLRTQIADERIEQDKQLRQLEAEWLAKRNEAQEVNRTLGTRTFDLGGLRKRVDNSREQSNYLSNAIGDYGNKVDSRLHIVERQRYGDALREARLALDNTKLSAAERFEIQLKVMDTSLDHLETALGGARFEGRAESKGIVKPGTFVIVGPTALFRSADGLEIGAAEELDSEEPTVVPYTSAEDRDAAAQLALGTGGSFPVDTTLGNAQKIEKIQETWWEHVQKGGAIMIPMAALAGAALLVVLLKWLSMLFVRRPSRRQVEILLDYMDGSDYASAAEHSTTLAGPGGRMLEAGAHHLGEPRELIEEVMFERILSARLRLQSWLPFVAICATSAPLLGLLGTVTGIMETFALMTEFGGGDPKVLSSGISAALVTTEYGLIVAIPSLLLHAFLSRKVKAVVDDMEKSAMRFMNHVRTVEPVDPVDAVEIA